MMELGYKCLGAYAVTAEMAEFVDVAILYVTFGLRLGISALWAYDQYIVTLNRLVKPPKLAMLCVQVAMSHYVPKTLRTLAVH